MTRFRHILEVAVKDGDSNRFATVIKELAGDNIPAKTGWAILNHSVEEIENKKIPWTHRPSKWVGDKRWKAILDKVDEMSRSDKYRMAMRGTAMETEGSEAVKPTLYCQVRFTRKDVPDDGTEEMFLISAQENTVRFNGPIGSIIVKVDGPYTYSHDDYWEEMFRYDADRAAIITPDWVHRTISKDDPEAVRLGGGGHGGAEFRFKLLDVEDIGRFESQAIKVERVNAPEEDAGYVGIIVTHNCWHQGIIPPKHRHLFKVNAEMVKGFNPGRTG